MKLRPPVSTLFPSATLFRPLGLCPVCGHEPGQLRQSRHCPDLDGPGPDAERDRDDDHDRHDRGRPGDRKSTRLNSSHANISYAVFCLKKKMNTHKSKTHTNK